MTGRGILPGSQCQCCLRQFKTNVQLCRHLRFTPTCRQRLQQAGFACPIEPGIGSRKAAALTITQAPVLQAEGPCLPLPFDPFSEERQRPVAEILDCLEHLDFDGALLLLSDGELWQRLKSAFSCVCASTDRLRHTATAWAQGITALDAALASRLEPFADWLLQGDLLSWLIPEPACAVPQLYTFRDSALSLSMLDLSLIHLPPPTVSEDDTVIVVAPASWARRGQESFWKRAVFYSHEECLLRLAEGMLPSFFEGPFEGTQFVLVALGLPALTDPWPRHLPEKAFQLHATEASFAGDLLRFFVRLLTLGVPSVLAAPPPPDPCVSATTGLPAVTSTTWQGLTILQGKGGPAADLLDEIIDYGYPQILEVDVLKKYITQGGTNKALDLNDQEQLKKITVQATGVCSWRAEGIKHKKNEVFIDVIEKVNILVSTKRERLRADVSGEILVNCKLSGMPECKFGMNDKLVMSADARARSSDKGIALDDYGFHQCVRLGKFDVDREITFIPPDEQFSLMTYRITENIESPFKLIPNVKVLGRTRLELSLQVTAMYDRNIEATNVRIDFPCPKNTAKAHIPSPGHGKARYDANESAVIWRIRRFPGRHEYNLLAEVELASMVSEKQWVRRMPREEALQPSTSCLRFGGCGCGVRGLAEARRSNAMVNYDKNIQGAKRDAARQAHEAKVKAKQDKEDARRAAAKAKREEKTRQLIESIAAEIDESEEKVYGDTCGDLCQEDGTFAITDPQVLKFLADHTDLPVQGGSGERLADALQQVLRPEEVCLSFDQFLDFLRENSVSDSTAVSKFLETSMGQDSIAKTEASAHALHIAQKMVRATFEKDKWDILLNAVTENLDPMVGLKEFIQTCKRIARCARLLQFVEFEMQAGPMSESLRPCLGRLDKIQ
eukprot:s2823_g1.t1